MNAKLKKLDKIKNFLICPKCRIERLIYVNNEINCPECREEYSYSENSFNFLSEAMIGYGKVENTENVSAHNYDNIALDIIGKYSDGMILDNGCGLRNVYYENVVNFEIANYPTTDVLGIGEKLPFKSNTFDAVFSLNVLEHVIDPFESASEIMRVLKPGGELYVVAPFLQPFHGYPNHYYNMSSKGLDNLFKDRLEIIKKGVPRSGTPIWALNWMLQVYLRGLPADLKNKFLKLRVKDLLRPMEELLREKYVEALDEKTEEELACTNFILGKKIKS